MKKVYEITLPKNKEVENTSVRIENGKVFVTVEVKDEFNPKDGDFLVSKWGCIFIYSDKKPRDNSAYSSYCGVSRETNIISLEFSDNWTNKEGCRYATKAEKKAFLERLEKECSKRWNPEEKELEDIRWRPSARECYFYADYDGEVRKTINVSICDAFRVSVNNCFKTEEAAKPYADLMKEIFKNSKAE